MTDEELPYNRSLAALESLLARVERPGDFCTHGDLALPPPLVRVDGVGLLSFPLPEAQALALIEVAERAPHGRGEKTVLDTSVRRVWQVGATQVHIGGKSWAPSLHQVLAAVARGLGCEGAAIRAELYKLLVYDPGGFFLAHRDSEKAPGMFGTLLVQLPSEHTGGELRVRHGGREASIDLSSIDCSELGFAAFYADCEHEVRPVESGHRLCLVFNLVRDGAGEFPAAEAPCYDIEAAQAARLIGATFAVDDAPRKLVWLLAHQYSRAELGFEALKGADAAVVGVLRRAADAAACAVHLAVVHIEESGPAEPHYMPSRGRYHREEFDDDDEIDAADYEVIEVSDSNRYIDHWIAPDGRAPPFGRVPLADGELLPAGGLDDEPRDEDRLLEATGNEGVNFERAYRRAALIVWPRSGHVDVLLQAGVGTALPELEAMLAEQGASASASDAIQRIVAHWSQRSSFSYAAASEGPLRARMLRCLAAVGPAAIAERFVNEVLVACYDGSENAALVDAAPKMLTARAFESLLVALVETTFLRCPRALCELLFLLEAANASARGMDPARALRGCIQALVDVLPQIAGRPARDSVDHWLTYEASAADTESCHRLLCVLERLGTEPQRDAAVTALISAPQVFDPAHVLVPALHLLLAENGSGIGRDAQQHRIWLHCCNFLLTRSEFPPPAPRDWCQPVVLSCSCDDCRTLAFFALDPHQHEQRFRVRKDRREHLHRQIESQGLDMTHVTERKGSPQTLVCRKTREHYRRQCRQHAEDIAAMRVLQALGDTALTKECARLAAAAARQPEAIDFDAHAN